MKRLIYCFLSIGICLGLTACKTENEIPEFELGEVSYYPKFGFCDAKTQELQKTLDLEFSEDAKADPSCSADLAFVDKEGKLMPTDVMVIKADGNFLEENILHLDPTMSSVALTISFTPQAESKHYQGYLVLQNYELDRFENQMLDSYGDVEVSKWSIQYDKNMNPLKVALIIIAVLIIVSLFIWFVFLKTQFYPLFKRCRKEFVVYKEGKVLKRFSIKFSKSREVVISDKKLKQNFFDRLFKGKVIFYYDSIFKDSLHFKPKKKKRIQAKGRNFEVQGSYITYNGESEIRYVNEEAKEKLIIKINTK